MASAHLRLEHMRRRQICLRHTIMRRHLLLGTLPPHPPVSTVLRPRLPAADRFGFSFQRFLAAIGKKYLSAHQKQWNESWRLAGEGKFRKGITPYSLAHSVKTRPVYRCAYNQRTPNPRVNRIHTFCLVVGGRYNMRMFAIAASFAAIFSILPSEAQTSNIRVYLDPVLIGPFL